MNKLSTSVKVTELGDTALRLVELFKQVSTLQNDLFLTKTIGEIEKLAQTLTVSVKSDIVISNLEQADKQRDQAIRVLDRLLKGYETIPLENLKEHAKKLMEVFKKYGLKITQENYSSQSNLITSMLEDFSLPRLKDSIEELQGVKEALEKIKTAQNEFAKIRSQYEGELVVKKEKNSATSLRKPVLELINQKLIPYLVAMQIAQPELFKEFTAKATEIINSTNDGVKARSKKEKKVKETNQQ